jgi:atypical dual specificity phosphatase
LHDVHFTTPQRGLMAIMGPSGVGKSTLLRTLGRWNDGQPAFWANGTVRLMGEEVLQSSMGEHVQRRLPMLAQKARLYAGSVMENILVDRPVPLHSTATARARLASQIFQPLGLWEEFAPLLDTPVMALSLAAHKKIVLARLLTQDARMLLVDEPLRDIAVAEEEALLHVLHTIARRCMVIMVTHNKSEAQRLCDTVCLVTGNTVVEVTPAAEFFASPRTALGHEFLRSGSCWPSATESAIEPPPAPVPPRGVYAPREFHWVNIGLLGGMQYPGLLGDVASDLEGLRALGVRVLVSLTEVPFDAQHLHAYGIEGLHYPIVDMSTPTLEQAEAMCQRLSALLDAQQPTVLHCKAGLGRTGTMLACVLVYRGMDAMRAIEAVRTVKPGYIQTEEQLAFVSTFATYVCQTAAACATSTLGGP